VERTSGAIEPGLTARPCEYCGGPIPDRRKDARYCSTSHRVMASRHRKRRAEIHESLVARGGPEFTAQSHADPDDDEHPDDEQGIVAGDAEPVRHESDIRFAAMIEQGHAPGGPSRDTRKAWRAYGKRHGTEHPGQTADRLGRHRAAVDARTARLDSMTDGRVQDRFDNRTRPNVGRSGADSRRINRRFLPDDDMPRVSPGFDFGNQTVDGGPYRAGRSEAGQRSRSADARWDLGIGEHFR
jgi:hypothetical protein